MAELSRDEAVAFLLGGGTEEEREAVERRLFEDETVADEVAAVEDELIDAYIAGGLPPSERGQFERAYLSSPERSDKVAFARALRERLSSDVRGRSIQGASGRPRALLAALAAAAVILLAMSSFLFFQDAKTRLELERARSEIAGLKTSNDQLAQQLEKTRGPIAAEPPSSRQPEALIASFELSPALVRDTSETRTLVVPKSIGEVRLILPVEEGSGGTYQATLTTVDGAKLWTSGPLRTRAEKSKNSIVVGVPANRLSTNDYILTLGRVDAKGRIRDVDDYFFRVKRD